jgi:hypothetical protein
MNWIDSLPRRTAEQFTDVSPQHWLPPRTILEQVRKLERDYRTGRFRNSREDSLNLMIKYLQALDGFLWASRISEEASLVLFDLQQALELSLSGKAHYLFDETAPQHPQGSIKRAIVEAHAAVALELGRGQLNAVAQVSEVLRSRRFWRPPSAHRPAAPYTAAALRKWRSACISGIHQRADLFQHFVATSDYEEALGYLRDRLDRGWRW